jgi:ATP-binding cassette, subfamily B, bacterial
VTTPDTAADDDPAVRTQGWRLLRGLLAEQRRGLAIGVGLGLLWSAGKVAVPQLTRWAVDRGIIGGGSLWWWSGLILVAGVVVGINTALRRWYAFRESRWLETRLRERLYAHLLGLHIGFHDRAQTGQLMTRASSDLQLIQGFVVMIPLTLSNLGLIVAVVVVLLITDPLLAVIALAPLPLVNVLARRFSNRVHPAVLAVQAEQGQLASVVEETVAGVRVVKGFGAEPVQAAKLRREANDVRVASLRAARIRSRYLPAIDVLPSLGLIAVLGLGGHRVMNGDMSLGELVAFNAYLVLLIVPLRTIGMTVAFGQRAAAALVRVQDLLAVAPAIVDPEHPQSLPPPPGGAVQFQAVTFGYDPERPVLDGFELDVPAGGSVALVGATASGKSTVARLLVRFYDVQHGSVRLDGIDVRDLTLNELRHNVAVVFEDTVLLHDTVHANIAFARPSATLDQVVAAARLAGAHEFITELPHGYDTLLGERGLSLSGGQRQRIAIARAVLADPRVLILDDATSAVDPSKEHEIRSAMATVMQGRTTIVIAHRPATIALADEVVLVGDGRVLARGRHHDLLVSEPRYAEVLARFDDHDVAPVGGD